MAEFLSPAWIEELDAAAVAVDDGITFVLDHVVTGGPGGDVRYRMTLEGGRLHVATLAGAGASPTDAAVTLSYGTAVELATGARTGSDAFDAGLVRFRGNLLRLQQATPALLAAAEALATLRPATTFPKLPSGTTG